MTDTDGHAGYRSGSWEIDIDRVQNESRFKLVFGESIPSWLRQTKFRGIKKWLLYILKVNAAWPSRDSGFKRGKRGSLRNVELLERINVFAFALFMFSLAHSAWSSHSIRVGRLSDGLTLEFAIEECANTVTVDYCPNQGERNFTFPTVKRHLGQQVRTS